MRIPPSSSCRALLEVGVPTSICRSLSTSATSTEAWRRDSSGPSSNHSKFKRSNEYRKQNRVSKTLLTASRLGRHADSIDKRTSDQYSGWKPSKGPSGSRNTGRPKLSRDASKSLVRAKESESVEILLGSHSASVLLQPLASAAEDVEDGFEGSEEAQGRGRLSSRDFITPRRDLKAGDFVELRRATSMNIGIVLPLPDDVQDQPSGYTALKDLYVLVTSGQIVLYKDNDVMMQIPNVVEDSLTKAAAPTSRKYVVNSISGDLPSNTDGTHDSHSSAESSANADPREGTALEEEPIVEARFQARASICNKLRILERQKEKELQRLLPSFQSLFLVDDKGRRTDRERKRRMDLRTGAITTFEAARLMHALSLRSSSRRKEEEFTASTIYAAHALLMSHPTHFLADALSHRTSQLFTCRSDGERANLELVSSWIAASPGSEGQEFIDAFCKKASKVREYAESHPPDPSGPPRQIDPPHPDLAEITWTEQDRAIIEFLQASLGSRREVQEDMHSSIAMEIVKRAGGHFRVLPYPNIAETMDVEKAAELLLADKGDKLGRSMLEGIGTDLHAGGDLQHALVMRFLTQIGALPPWQNPIRLDASFRNATMGEDGGEPESPPSSDTMEDGVGVAKKFSLSLDEQVEAIRHDFGKDHTVYVIDDEGAFELDDGISVEPVKGKEQAWVHIHIADPTAWIQPDDPLGQRAERRFGTLYLPEARWALLPDEFVRSGVGLRSSSSGGNNGEGQRVMTFSALLDLSTGLVQDTRVRPALVHDVQTTSYNKVSAALAEPEEQRPAELSLLLKAASLLSENRTRSTGLFAYRPKSSLSVSPLPLPSVPVSASALQRPYFFAGFPTIEVSSATASPSSEKIPQLAQFVVSEMMILAGRIAASYGHNHNLPLPYRYQLRPESDAEAAEILTMRTNLPSPDSKGTTSPISIDGMVGYGLLAYDELLLRGLSLSASGYSATPGEHFSLGVSSDSSSPFYPLPSSRDALSKGGYIRSTSPLRRYPDMIAHWQLKHHLVSDKPRFRTHEMEKLLPQLERQEVTAKQLMRSAERFWLYTLLQRTLLGKEGGEGLRGPWTATVLLPDIRINTSTLMGKVRVNLDGLGIPADLEWEAGTQPPVKGDSFEVVSVSVIMAGIRSGLVVRRA